MYDVAEIDEIFASFHLHLRYCSIKWQHCVQYRVRHHMSMLFIPEDTCSQLWQKPCHQCSIILIWWRLVSRTHPCHFCTNISDIGETRQIIHPLRQGLTNFSTEIKVIWWGLYTGWYHIYIQPIRIPLYCQYLCQSYTIVVQHDLCHQTSNYISVAPLLVELI